jgi:hypothetical protein
MSDIDFKALQELLDNCGQKPNQIFVPVKGDHFMFTVLMSAWYECAERTGLAPTHLRGSAETCGRLLKYLIEAMPEGASRLGRIDNFNGAQLVSTTELQDGVMEFIDVANLDKRFKVEIPKPKEEEKP